MYHFYIGGDLLPLAPSKIEVRVGSSNEVINLVSTGDYNVLKNIGLTDFNFEVLLPGKPLPGMAIDDEFRFPIYYIEKIRQYKENIEPVRLIITRAMQSGADIFTTNIMVGIQSHSFEEEAGYEGDIIVTLRLREHREPADIKTEVVSIATPAGSNDAGAGYLQSVANVTQEHERPTKPIPREHTVVPGDTLWAIAKRELNDGRRYMEIAQLNNIRNPNLIFPGQVLRLP